MASSGIQVPVIIYEIRIRILTLTKLYLDMHQGIWRVTYKSVPGWPAESAAGGLQEPPGKSMSL